MKLPRRRVLGAGLAAAACGALPSLLTARSSSAATDRPKRVVIIFTPNGPQHEVGPTQGTETAFTLHPWWSPLQRHVADGLFFRGVHVPGVPFGKIDEYGHQSGTAGALTARCTEGTSTGTGPSLDQYLGQQLFQRGVLTPKRSLLWGLYDNADGPFYEAAAQPVAPVSNPYTALAALAPSFGSSNGMAMVDEALNRKRFILDHIRDDCARLRGRLGAEGRAMLDFHCSNIETLEKSLSVAMTAPALECKMPTGPIAELPEKTNFSQRETRDVAMASFTKLIPLSFICDVTRVIAVSFAPGAARFSIPEKYGVASSAQVDSGDSGPQMHAWTHQGRDNPGTLPSLQTFYHWFSTHVANIIDELKNNKDADGVPLLNSTLVLWTSEFGAGMPHTNTNIPVMLFGNSGGQFKTGRHFEASGDTKARAMVMHNLFVSIIRHAGLSDIDTFGNAGSGPLDWLKG